MINLTGKNYGKAVACENPLCKKASHTFQWSLKKGRGYKHIKDNFRQLCCSCHRLYDQTPEWIEKMRHGNTGRNHTQKWKDAISRGCKGIHKGNKHSAKSIEQKSLDGRLIKIWTCISDAAKQLNIVPSGITMCARGELKKSGGFRWNYPNK